MKKVLSILLCSMLLLSISACQMTERTPTDELKFLRAAEELSFSTGDSTDTYIGMVNVEKAVYATDGKGCDLEFLRCRDVTEAARFYQSLIDMAERASPFGVQGYNSVNFGENYSRYQCTAGEIRFRFVRVENTVLCAQYAEDDIPSVRTMFETLGYE